MIKLKDILNEHQLLPEKVSKQEFKDALNSTDVMIGSEFEGNWLKNLSKNKLKQAISKIVGTNNINFVDYHGGNKNTWNFQKDASLGYYGLELTGPPLNLQDWLTTTPKLFKLLSKAGGTDSNAGFHINISFKNPNKKINPLKLLLFFEEGKVYKFFQSRKNNRYSKSIKHLFDKDNEDSNAPKNKITKLDDIEQDFSSKISMNKYFGVNFNHLIKQNYIEFRYIGGKGYEKKWNEIKDLVAMYITVMKIASDPNYKRKEYIKKLYKLANNLDVETTDNVKLDANLYKNIKKKVKSFNGKTIKVQILTEISKNKKLSTFIKNNDFKDAELELTTSDIIWKDGTWINGTWDGEIWEDGTWKNGTWKSGIWKDGFWKNGTWEWGVWNRGVWEDGTWINGTWFNGIWKNGIWKNGVWKVGTWQNGTWMDGTWTNGIWIFGNWKDGFWKHGTWKDGVWKYGIWMDGIWRGGLWNGGIWNGGTWIDGKWRFGLWKNGIWKNGTWEGGTWRSDKPRPNKKRNGSN